MNARTIKNKQGFTIIEVVLVLAIAALIFLMVFIALPALQRNQRDTARKTVLGKVASAITSYQSNNRGRNPTDAAAIKGYVDGTPIAATGNILIEDEYTIQVDPLSAADTYGGAANDFVQVYTRAKCADNNKATTSGATSRQAAVIIQLENGDAFLCQSV